MIRGIQTALVLVAAGCGSRETGPEPALVTPDPEFVAGVYKYNRVGGGFIYLTLTPDGRYEQRVPVRREPGAGRRPVEFTGQWQADQGYLRFLGDFWVTDPQNPEEQLLTEDGTPAKPEFIFTIETYIQDGSEKEIERLYLHGGDSLDPAQYSRLRKVFY